MRKTRGNPIGSDATGPRRGFSASTHEHTFDLFLRGLILSRVADPLFSAPGHVPMPQFGSGRLRTLGIM